MIQGPSDPSSFSCRLKRPICIAIWSLCIRFIFLVQFLLCTAQNIFFFIFFKEEKEKKIATTHCRYAAKVQTDVLSINALRDRHRE